MKKFRSFEYRVDTDGFCNEVTVYISNFKVATIIDFEVNEEEDITEQDALEMVTIWINNEYHSFNVRMLTDLADLVKMLVYGEE